MEVWLESKLEKKSVSRSVMQMIHSSAVVRASEMVLDSINQSENEYPIQWVEQSDLVLEESRLAPGWVRSLAQSSLHRHRSAKNFLDGLVSGKF